MQKGKRKRKKKAGNWMKIIYRKADV